MFKHVVRLMLAAVLCLAPVWCSMAGEDQPEQKGGHKKEGKKKGKREGKGQKGECVSLSDPGNHIFIRTDHGLLADGVGSGQ